MNKILFLLGNISFAEQTIKHLISDGIEFNFKIVDSGDKFKTVIEDFNPNIIITEIQVGTLNFRDSINIAKANNFSTQVIILSNNTNDEEEIECLNSGAFDYLSMANTDKLVVSVKKVFGSLATSSTSNNNLHKEFYKGIIDQAPDAIFRGNYRGEFKEVNSAACELTGYSKKELLNMKMRDLFSEKELVLRPLQYELIDKGHAIINERVLIRKDGTSLPINMNTKLINSSTYFCIMRDLTDQNKVKRELYEKEQRMRSIIEHSSNLFYAHDANGTFTYISPKTRDFFDCEPEYFIEMNSSMYSDNPINDIGKLKTKEAIKTGISQDPFECELIGKTGRKVWVEVHEEPIVVDGVVTEIVGALVDITESKKTKDLLIQSEKKFRTLFSEAPQGVFLTDSTGILVECNRAFCDIMECDEESIIGKHITDFLFEDGKKEFKNKFPILHSTGKVSGEIYFKTKTGKRLLTYRSVSAIYDDNGQYAGAIAHIIDITEQRKNQKEIIESEARLRAIFNASDNISFVLSDVSKDNIIINEFSPGAESIFGYSKEEVVGKAANLLYLKDNPDNIKKYFDKLKTGNGSIKDKIELVKKDGSTFMALHTGYPIYNESGKIIQILAVAVDLTNVIEIENELKEREEQLTNLINASPDIICIKNGTGQWLMANEAIISVLGLKDFVYKNKTNSDIIDFNPELRDYMNSFTKSDEKAWQSKKTTINEVVVTLNENNSSTYEIIKVPVFHTNGDRKVLVILGRDISRRKQLEQQLQHSQKMEAIGLMAGGIAHNFNNILQAVIGYIDFAKDGLEEESQRYNDIEQIGKHIKRATSLTKSLMAVGKDQFLDKKEIDVADIIQPIVDLTNRNNTNNVDVEFNKAKELPPLMADGSQLDQVIMNIFINAIDAMPAGGKIVVDVVNQIIDDNFCKSNAWAKPGNYIKISITDTGHGMDEDTKRRIFEPYFTTKEIHKGTGLGLSTAFGIISQHQGMVNVISQPHKGTTFEVFLPLYE